MPIPPKPKPPIVPMVPTMAPYDYTYQSNMAADQMNRNNQLAQLQQSGTLDQADTAEALRRLAQQRGQAMGNFNNNASRNGSLLSGRATLGYGRLGAGYLQRGNDVQSQLARRMANRTLQQQQLQQGASIYQGQQAAANTDRAAMNAYNNRLALLMAGKKV